MDVLDLHDRARASTARIVAGVQVPTSSDSPHRASSGTSARSWVTWSEATGCSPTWPRATPWKAQLLADPVALRALATDDPAGAYEETARVVSEAWRGPGALERTVHMPFGDVPGPFAVTLHFVDTLVHGWDVARATGQDTDLDPELAGAALAFARENLLVALRGPGRPFGLEVPTTSTSVGDQLVAFMGRTP